MEDVLLEHGMFLEGRRLSGSQQLRGQGIFALNRQRLVNFEPGSGVRIAQARFQ